jgi:hypothetical protein
MARITIEKSGKTYADRMYLRGFISGVEFCIAKKGDIAEMKALHRAFKKKLMKMYKVV